MKSAGRPAFGLENAQKSLGKAEVVEHSAKSQITASIIPMFPCANAKLASPRVSRGAAQAFEGANVRFFGRSMVESFSVRSMQQTNGAF